MDLPLLLCQQIVVNMSLFTFFRASMIHWGLLVPSQFKEKLWSENCRPRNMIGMILSHQTSKCPGSCGKSLSLSASRLISRSTTLHILRHLHSALAAVAYLHVTDGENQCHHEQSEVGATSSPYSSTFGVVCRCLGS